MCALGSGEIVEHLPSEATEEELATLAEAPQDDALENSPGANRLIIYIVYIYIYNQL